MTQLVNNYLTDLVNIERKWINNTIDPFCLAYIDAHKSYTTTFKAQQAINKQQAELAYLALSLMGGSALAVLFRKASVSSSLKDGAITAMFRTNSMTVFNMAASLEASPTANFIIGSLYTTISSQIKKEVTAGVQKSIKRSSATLQLKSPLEVQITFTHYLRAVIIQAADFARNIRDNKKLDDKDKNKIISQLKLAPIANPPLSIGKEIGARAKDIELLFYMKLILKSDYLRTIIATASLGGASVHAKEHGAIITAPSSASYPQTKDTAKISGGLRIYGVFLGGGTATRTIEGPAYHDIGKAFESRLEVLYQAKTGQHFYKKDGSDLSFITGSIMGQAEMLRAENIIKRLVSEYALRMCPV